MFSALRLEKELDGQGIPLFATDEPAQIEGINATSVLVRRIKQGIAEWYRIQLKNKVRKGLKEHSLDGWNLGPVPYGYAGDRFPHPIPAKAAEGRTKTRLIPDPVRGPIVTLIYQWRVSHHLGTPTIAARLNADPIRYPAPSPETGWTAITVGRILTNPKYTGYMVLGRTRRQKNKTRLMPPDQWIWSAQPTHDALVGKDTWDAAQRAGADHGNVRDSEMPSTRPGRRYQLRSRLWCKICRRRMRGATRTGPAYRATYTYYRCPHDKTIPRHAAAHPGHPSVTVREDDLMTAVTRFFGERCSARTGPPCSPPPSRPAPPIRPPSARPRPPRSGSSSLGLIPPRTRSSPSWRHPPSRGTRPRRLSATGSAPASPTCTPNGPGSKPNSPP